MAEQHVSQRASVLRALFGVLYRNRTLYWLASTIPFAGQWRRWQRLVLWQTSRAGTCLRSAVGWGRC